MTDHSQRECSVQPGHTPPILILNPLRVCLDVV
jgi:hypothetical protein